MFKLEQEEQKICKSFHDWSAEGYTINKGSKGTKMNGMWMFSLDQVSKRFNRSSGGGDPREADDYEGDWDDTEDWGMSPMDWGDN